ncbi:MAG: YicC/YloC family endoribonuclease [Candidatus Marinimicrobia bacterium]|nr:YicC/YloC family endoribonuclease [Candidatus Neomarinimicrobiota bacterium]
MLISMTGFGKAAGTIEGNDISVELRSVNSRYLEIFVAVPKFLNFLEDTCKKNIREHIQRGNIHCFINIAAGNNTLANYTVNMPLLRNYIETVRTIARKTGIEPQVTMQDLLTQPELLALEESRIDPDILSNEMTGILDKAIAGLLEMEKNEGRYIKQIFIERLQSTENHLTSIIQVQKENISTHISQMRERVGKLLEDQPGELFLNQEIVQMADKLDISEEVDRFKSHIVQFHAYLDMEETVGKRLNFLLQEMNREVTTMGNKASNSEISQHVVEIKNEIETIREQVQNIQ